MLITAILLLITFVLLMIFISSNIFDRAILALAAGIVTYFLLFFFESENFKFTTFMNILFGTAEDGYVNMHSLILILGMMIIVAISVEGGVFQFLSFRLIQMTKGKPIYLLITFSILSFLITSIINDILTVILLIPLTITICRLLRIDPVPYVITEGIIIKIGATLLLISSIPNILVSAYLGLSFNNYFTEIGYFSIIIFIITLIIFLLFYRRKFAPPVEGIDMLLTFNVWDFISNKALTIKSISVLISVVIGFIVIPSELISPDIIAISGAVILLIICGKNSKEILKKIDFKLLLFLIGIFMITGALEFVGIITFLANSLGQIAINNSYTMFLIILWLSSLISSLSDTVSTTRIFIPTVNILSTAFPQISKMNFYGGMIYGINWGDNLTPFGDTLLAINMAEQNKCTVKLTSYFKIAFPVAFIQLCIISIIFALIMEPLVGILLLGLGIGIVLFIFIAIRNQSKITKLTDNLKEKVRKKIKLSYKKS